jgi:carbamoyltransferase
LGEIESALERRKVKFEKLTNPEQVVAKILSCGEVIAVFHGCMEFGYRALGFRPILGDLRAVSMKDKINSTIKYRESYRPFAPAV